MRLFRQALFWLHLAAGLTAAIVVAIMSVTGVALTYQRQMQLWADRGEWTPPGLEASRLSAEALIARVCEQQPNATPTTITLRADRAQLATVALTGGSTPTVLVDPYTGEIVARGKYAAGMRSFFSSMVAWHRYVALAGHSRATGRAITGASNLLFLFLVLSGVYLWWPRSLTWAAFRNILMFRRVSGKARDFNWHNVIGFWSAIPLAIVVASATVISYPWASNLVYRVAGEDPPAPSAPNPERPAGAGASRSAIPSEPAASPSVTGMDLIAARASAHVPDWTSLAIRLPASERGAVTVTIDQGDGGQPQKRGTLTIDRATVEVTRWEPFESQSRGRRWRSILRFSHTGEVLGRTGQTIAGLVSLGAVVMVYSGVALSVRRFGAWVKRRRR